MANEELKATSEEESEDSNVKDDSRSSDEIKLFDYFNDKTGDWKSHPFCFFFIH